jgi:hypothetical protein
MRHHPAFQPRPHLAQFARGGSWEAAWSFGRDSVPAQAECLAYLDGAGEVAFEAFFGDAFFGVRIEGDAGRVAGQAVACALAFAGARDGADFFARLEEGCGWQGLGCSAPSFTELGAVNAWRSVGSHRLAPPEEALSRLDALWPALSGTPLARDVAHRKALEFAYERPVPHWFALPVSSGVPPHALSRDLLGQALASAL